MQFIIVQFVVIEIVVRRYNHSTSAVMLRIRWMDVMMKILLPLCFIALKLTGTFIDFMLGLSNSNVKEEITTAQARDL